MKAFMLGLALILGTPLALAEQQRAVEVAPAASAQAEAAPLEEAIPSAIQQLEEQLDRNEAARDKLLQAAEEVRRAHQEWRDSSGAVARMVALDRLRTLRQNHHQAARQLKESRGELSQALQNVAREAARLEREMQEQAGQIEAAKAQGASARVQQLEKIQARHERLREQTEKRLEQLAPRIGGQVEMDPGDFGPGGERPWGPPEGFRRPGMEPSEAPDAPDSPPSWWWSRDDRQRRGLPFLERYQKQMEAMEQRIEQLEQEIGALKTRLQQIEERQGEGQGSRRSPR